MEQNENIGTLEEQGNLDPALEESFIEEADEEQPISLGEALSDAGTADADQTGTDEGNSSQSAGERSEPGYVQKRINKAVAETEARLRAEFEQQMAPYREQMLNQQAQELVRTGKVRDLETAKELIRYRQGMPAASENQADSQGQPRNERGQFTSGGNDSGRDPATQARIDMLQHQADRIKGQKGIDVIAEFQNNEETRRKIVSGEWDFYDVADMLAQQPQRKRAPSPMRSPNGASVTGNRSVIESLSDEQFDRMVKKVQGGARYSQR